MSADNWLELPEHIKQIIADSFSGKSSARYEQELKAIFGQDYVKPFTKVQQHEKDVLDAAAIRSAKLEIENQNLKIQLKNGNS